MADFRDLETGVVLSEEAVASRGGGARYVPVGAGHTPRETRVAVEYLDTETGATLSADAVAARGGGARYTASRFEDPVAAPAPQAASPVPDAPALPAADEYVWAATGARCSGAAVGNLIAQGRATAGDFTPWTEPPSAPPVGRGRGRG